MKTPEVTTRAYERTHGKQPAGSGSWAFQGSTTRSAFSADVTEPQFFYGEYRDVVKQAREAFAEFAFVSVSP